MTRAEHHFVSLASDQKSVNCLHELRADASDFPAPVNPIVAAVLAGDVVVETVSETEGYFAHGLSYRDDLLGVNSPMRRPAADTSISFSSRFSLVSSFFALTIHQFMTLRYPGG